MFGLRPIHLYFPTDQYEKFARYAASRGIGIDAAVIDLATHADAAELELSQERFMRQAAEAEVARLQAVLSDAVSTAQAALNAGGDMELIYAAGYQAALEDIAALDNSNQAAGG
jgi:hypothetical protein